MLKSDFLLHTKKMNEKELVLNKKQISPNLALSSFKLQLSVTPLSSFFWEII